LLNPQNPFFVRRASCQNKAPVASHPWTVEQIPGGYKVKDATGQSLAYVYGRETKAERWTRRGASRATSRTCPTFLGRRT